MEYNIGLVNHVVLIVRHAQLLILHHAFHVQVVIICLIRNANNVRLATVELVFKRIIVHNAILDIIFIRMKLL